MAGLFNVFSGLFNAFTLVNVRIVHQSKPQAPPAGRVVERSDLPWVHFVEQSLCMHSMRFKGVFSQHPPCRIATWGNAGTALQNSPKMVGRIVQRLRKRLEMGVTCGLFSNPHHLLTPANYPRFPSAHAITGLKTRKQGVSRPSAPPQRPSSSSPKRQPDDQLHSDNDPQHHLGVWSRRNETV